MTDATTTLTNAAAVEDVFCRSVVMRLKLGASPKLMDEDVRLTVEELLRFSQESENALPRILIEKKDLSFQDMQAIGRAFRLYVGVDIEKNETVNNIIFAQACRHVIVHAGGEVTARLCRQVSGAVPRGLKNNLQTGSVIQFSEAEVTLVADSMKSYMANLLKLVEG